LRTIEQSGRTCDEYMQEFKKIARESSYKRRPLIKEFKRGLNGAIRRKLAEVEELLIEIKGFDHETKVKVRSERQNL